VQWPKQFYQWGRDGKRLAWEEPRKVTGEEYKIGPHCGKPDDKLAPYEAAVSVAMGVLPHTLAARWSDGHLFNIEPFRWQGQSVGGRTHKSLQEYLPTGKMVSSPAAPIIWKLSDAAVGPRFDAAGNIYIAEAIRPTDWIMPPELADYYSKKGVEVKLNGKRGGWYTGYKGLAGVGASMYGSILKFTPKGGMVHWDKDPKKGPQGCGQEPYIGEPKLDPSLKTVEVEYGGEYIRYVKVTGTEWIHPGMSHVGFFACNCENVTFEVDEFGRTFFPDPAQFRVCVIDTAGNDLTTFGGYGDANCMGPESPVVDPKTGRVRPRRANDPKDLKSPFSEPEIALSWLVGVGVTDRHIYLGDSMNQRLLRTRLVYAAEETCAIGSGGATASAPAPAPARATAAAPPVVGKSDWSDRSDKSDRSDPPKSAARSPEKSCQGWFSMARNYKSAGLVEEARRCLGNIVREYPDTEWATRARAELGRL
jgi:hypothetical protein